MKAIIFARVSSKEHEDGQSIPAQVRRLTEYALRKNFKIESTFQVTESSTKETRKQFDEVVNFIIKSKEPYALITDTVDRLQRSFRETPLLDELRKQGKIELHFLRDGLIVSKDSNSSQLLQWDMGVLFSSSYVRQLGDNVKRSQEQCIRNGQWISKAPYGYKNVALPSGQKTIEVNQEQAEIVVKIFEEYAKGNNSFQTIAVKLKEGFPLTSRGKSITDRTVEIILKNSCYMGMMCIKGQLYPHKYPTLISEELFNNLQDIIYKCNKSPVQFAGKDILLRGLITCKNCNGAVTGDIKKGKYVYYSCHNSKRICTKKWVKEEVLLKEMLGYFDQIQLTDEQINELVETIEDQGVQEQEFIKNTQRLLNEKLNLTQDRISKLIDMHIDGKIDSDTYHYKLDEYKKEQQSLMLEIKSYSTDSRAELNAAREVLEMTNEAKELFMSSKLDEKQQLLRFFILNLTLTAEKLDVELSEPFNLIAKSCDRHVWRG